MTTPISSSVPYCTAARLRELHDWRQLGDLILDTGARETTEALFDSSSKVQSALMRASGRIESMALRGTKYSVQDLQSLTGAGRAYLEELVGEIAWWNLFRRRFPKAEMEPATILAFQDLEALGHGSLIFGLADQADAGNPKSDFMTSSDLADLGLTTYQARRFFGRRTPYLNGGGLCGGSASCCDY